MYLDRYTLILSPLHTRVSSCNRWDHVWGTADDTSVVCSTNGSIDLDNFPRMAYHFVKRLPKGFGKGGKPTILIMDGHSSRWSPSALRMLRDNNVHVWVIASHSSAWGQVGDVGPNSKLSKHYNNQARKWRAAHPLYKMKCHHFNAIFTKAYDLYEKEMREEFAETGTNTIIRAYTYTGFDPLVRESPGSSTCICRTYIPNNHQYSLTLIHTQDGRRR